MKRKAYKDALRAAVTELNGLLYQRQQLQHELERNHEEILTVKQTVAALAHYIGTDRENPTITEWLTDEPRGLKESCLRAMSYQDFKTIHGIMETMKRNGFNLARYTSPYAAVQTTLTRLNGTEIETAEKDGKTGYKRIPTSKDIPLEQVKPTKQKKRKTK